MGAVTILELVLMALDAAATLSSTALKVASVLQSSPDLTDEQRAQLIAAVRAASAKLQEIDHGRNGN